MDVMRVEVSSCSTSVLSLALEDARAAHAHAHPARERGQHAAAVRARHKLAGGDSCRGQNRQKRLCVGTCSRVKVNLYK